MVEIPKELEPEKSRFRKLGLCVLALLLVHVTQAMSKQPVTWPVFAVDSIVVLSFVASNVLSKFVESTIVKEAIGKARGVISPNSG